MTIDPEKFGTWRVQLFCAAIGVLIVASLFREFFVVKEASPTVVGFTISLSVIPLAGPAAARILRGKW